MVKLKYVFIAFLIMSCNNQSERIASKKNRKSEIDLSEYRLTKKKSIVSDSERGIQNWMGVTISGNQKNNLFPEGESEITLYATEEDNLVNKITVDLNRDGEIDEKWFLNDNRIYRKVLNDKKLYQFTWEFWILMEK